MNFLPSRLLSCVAAGGLICAAALCPAQSSNDAGYVRVSDGPAAIAAAGGRSAQPVVTVGGLHGDVNQGQMTNCPQCQTGNCPHGNCPSGYCPHGCYGGHQCTQHVHAFLDWFNPHGACTHSPDHGFNPPIKSPIYRRGVAYNKFFPDAWMGIPSPDLTGMQRAPVVYMPTDTTQLGYYYQQVPRWTPVRGMIPPAPYPRDWHFTCQDKLGGYCPEGGEQIIQGEVIESYKGVPGKVIEAQPNALPIESAPTPEPVDKASLQSLVPAR